jgi:hypothetical protein
MSSIRRRSSGLKAEDLLECDDDEQRRDDLQSVASNKHEKLLEQVDEVHQHTPVLPLHKKIGLILFRIFALLFLLYW